MWYFHQLERNQMSLLSEAAEVKTTQQKKNQKPMKEGELTILIMT